MWIFHKVCLLQLFGWDNYRFLALRYKPFPFLSLLKDFAEFVKWNLGSTNHTAEQWIPIDLGYINRPAAPIDTHLDLYSTLTSAY
jgi:hypothetical protein